MYKHIIFDFGGVFLNADRARHGMEKDLAKIFNIPEKEAYEIWKAHLEKVSVDEETPREFLVLINKQLGLHLNIGKAYAKWKSYNMLEKEQINWDLLDYVKQLKKRYKVHMLTNRIDLDNDSDKLTNELYSRFENVFVSHKEKLRKPDTKAFLNAIAKMGADPEECVFVDDLQQNVTVANELGIKGVLFTNLKTLKMDFKKLGIS